MATEGAAPAGFRGRLASALRLDDARRGWRRLPALVRRLLPATLLLALAGLYPWLFANYLGELSVPVIRQFPSVSTAVIMIVFMMMAVGLNIVVGYAGLLDLGYVAF